MVDIEKALSEKFPSFAIGKPAWLKRPLVALLRWLFREQEINAFLAQHGGCEGLEFIERVMDYFRFSYTVSNTELENIPTSGRVVIVANHPLGGLDALALLQLVGSVRDDVRVVANDMLMNITPLQRLFLPMDNLRGNPSEGDVRRIQDALLEERAIILFPAGEVSRIRPSGVRDTQWSAGFLHFAKRASAPVLPVFMNARNSAFFYIVAMVSKPLAGLLLVQEMWRQRGRRIAMTVGELIPAEHIDSRGLSTKAQVNLVKKHLYRIAHQRRGLFITETAISHPEDSKQVRKALQASVHLGRTRDNKLIYLFDSSSESPVIREIGRLRELTFRQVGEGTGRRRDLDDYDYYYQHLVLWDEDELEIVGAYRIANTRSVYAERGREGFYSHTLFPFGDAFCERYLNAGIEFGRSFVQPHYWGSRALDYLWQGIGAYLADHSEVRWLFGPVSISNTYPAAAKDTLVFFYRRHFGDDTGLVSATQRYVPNDVRRAELESVFALGDYKSEFALLKEQLAHYGVAVPTLFKQYTEICEPGGVRFLEFNVDPDFGYCVDGMMVLDLEKIKASKRARYIRSGHAEPGD